MCGISSFPIKSTSQAKVYSAPLYGVKSSMYLKVRLNFKPSYRAACCFAHVSLSGRLDSAVSIE